MSANRAVKALTPVSAAQFYDVLSDAYDDYAIRSSSYLAAVDDIIIGRIRSAETMLDAGCGTGRRMMRLGSRLGVRKLVGVDSSVGMVAVARERVPSASIVHADIAHRIAIEDRFDLVTCLWNVVGHVERASRVRALANLRALLKPSGRLFVDVNNRYNIRAYGLWVVGRNLIDDWLRRSQQSGDVIVTIDISGARASTRSHVFTDSECCSLFRAAALQPVAQWFLNYETGQPASEWSGQILYELSG